MGASSTRSGPGRCGVRAAVARLRRFSSARAGPGLFACALSLWNVGHAADYEREIESFDARLTFPRELLTGPGYEVDLDVINQDFMNHYRVRSRFGDFTARGDAQLYVRIREVHALNALDEMSKGRVFVDSAGATVTTAVDNVSTAVEDPSTLKSGFSRLMKRLGRMTRNAYRRTKSLLRRDEDQQEEAAETGQQVTRSLLGVNRAYRDLARELRVDPYTRNALLAEEMDSMAKVSAAGSLGVKGLIPVLPLLYGATYVIGVSNLIYNTHPVDLQLHNEKALHDMGVDPGRVKKLVENEWHTLTTQTRITASLGSMQGVSGREVLVRHASDAASVGDALLYTRMIELLALYHQRREPIERIVGTERIPFAVTRRRAVVMVPVDYLKWTRRAAELVRHLSDRMSGASRHPELWVTGRISSQARTVLGGQGWALFARAGQRI